MGSKRRQQKKDEEKEKTVEKVEEEEKQEEQELEGEEEEEESEEEEEKEEVMDEQEEEEDGSTTSSSEQEDMGDGDDNNEENDVKESAEDEGKGEKCMLEVRHLVAMNEHEVNNSVLFSGSPKESEDCLIEATEDLCHLVNEDFLLNKTSEGCKQLISALFSLPKETRSDIGVLATLPTKPTSTLTLPRELPAPKPKPPSKWEKFAQERGITTSKNKRSRKVFDENEGEWKYITGYQKANKEENWPIMEVGANDDPFQDPWEKLRSEKRQRIEKNNINRIRNEEKAGNVPRGTTWKVIKDVKHKEKQRQQCKLPSGIPVDLQPNKTDAVQPQQRGKERVQNALKATQRSTASLGNFDAMREGEPDRPRSKQKHKKSFTGDEKECSLKLLQKVIAGGGSQKDREIRKGNLAKGETAYDYDFDDGLGSSTFRKKKGRAGAGKMKKVTKKRIK